MKIKKINIVDSRILNTSVRMIKKNLFGKEYYIAGSYIKKVKEPIYATIYGRKTCILNDGYIWIQMLNIQERFVITMNYDRERRLLQWYFDITKRNFLDESNYPCYEDEYIDVVLNTDGSTQLLDKNELKESLIRHEITQEEYQNCLLLANQVEMFAKENFHTLSDISYMLITYFSNHFDTLMQQERELKREKNKVTILEQKNKIDRTIKSKNQIRNEIKKGLKVKIVLKKDQKTGILTEGIVKDILTSSSVHHRGIKVRLEDGQVGRVQEILEE